LVGWRFFARSGDFPRFVGWGFLSGFVGWGFLWIVSFLSGRVDGVVAYGGECPRTGLLEMVMAGTVQCSQNTGKFVDPFRRLVSEEVVPEDEEEVVTEEEEEVVTEEEEEVVTEEEEEVVPEEEEEVVTEEDEETETDEEESDGKEKAEGAGAERVPSRFGVCL
jgi:outer membrane biosynthesis protein TonB